MRSGLYIKLYLSLENVKYEVSVENVESFEMQERHRYKNDNVTIPVTNATSNTCFNQTIT